MKTITELRTIARESVLAYNVALVNGNAAPAKVTMTEAIANVNTALRAADFESFKLTANPFDAMVKQGCHTLDGTEASEDKTVTGALQYKESGKLEIISLMAAQAAGVFDGTWKYALEGFFNTLNGLAIESIDADFDRYKKTVKLSADYIASEGGSDKRAAAVYSNTTLVGKLQHAINAVSGFDDVQAAERAKTLAENAETVKAAKAKGKKPELAKVEELKPPYVALNHDVEYIRLTAFKNHSMIGLSCQKKMVTMEKYLMRALYRIANGLKYTADFDANIAK